MVTNPSSLPSIIAGRYRVIRELGRGGMGAVYLVEHVHTGEQLALKVLLAEGALQPDAIERFKREARAPARIRSEHVVRVTDADVAPELGGAPFMVMEALNGKDLEAVVKERGKLPPTEVSWMLGQVASALDKAHAIGIVHRDLKPENIFLHTRDDGSPIIKILDFGISKIREKDGDPIAAAGLTQTGAVMGTPLYMSPEQARGNTANLVGPQTDIWALGLVTIRLLSGDMYWYGVDTLADLLMKIMVDPLPPPSVRWPLLGTSFDAWFERSCERDLSRRFTSVGEQVRAFQMVVGGTSMSSSVTSNMSALPQSGQLGGTVVLGASSSPQHQQSPPSYRAVPVAPTTQTGPQQGNTAVAGSSSHQPTGTGPQLPQVLSSTPNPMSGGGGAIAQQHQTGPTALVQSGSGGQSAAFIQLQSTTSGGAMVRPSSTTDPPRASGSGKLVLVLAPLFLIMLVGGVGAAVYSRRLGSHTPPPTPSATETASASVVASMSPPPAVSTTATADPTTLTTTTASTPVADVKPTATTKPAATQPKQQPTATTAKTAPTTTPPATASTKFNPLAP